MSDELKLNFLSNDEAGSIRNILKGTDPLRIAYFLEGADEEIQARVEVMNITADQTLPSESKEALASMEKALLRAQKTWKELGNGGRLEIGMALANRAGETNELARRGTGPDLNSAENQTDKLSLIFLSSDDEAAKTIGAFLDLLLGAVGSESTHKAFADLPRPATRFSEEKATFLGNISFISKFHLELPASMYEFGTYGKIAHVLMTSLYRHLGLETEPKNFRDDLEAGYRLAID